MPTKIEAYHGLKLGYLPVATLTIRHSLDDGNAMQQSLEIVLGTEKKSATLVFTNVSELRIEGLHARSKCYLDIVSLSGRQLEKARYQVMNVEQDLTLSFFCFDFDFVRSLTPSRFG